MTTILLLAVIGIVLRRGLSVQRETFYLDADDVLSIYSEYFHVTAQQAVDQLRSRKLLESAAARPANYAFYARADLAQQAAAVAHGIAESQPFIEGNKRMALATMRAFLLLNGYEITATQEDRAQWVLLLSQGLTVEDLAANLRGVMIEVDYSTD